MTLSDIPFHALLPPILLVAAACGGTDQAYDTAESEVVRRGGLPVYAAAQTFDVAETGTALIDTGNTSCGGRTTLTLNDQSTRTCSEGGGGCGGSRTITTIVAPEGRCPHIQRQLGPGRYEAVISSTVQVGAPRVRQYPILQDERTFTGWYPSSPDRFRFTLTRTVAIRAETTGQYGRCPGDTQLRLLDRAGATVREDDDSGGERCSRIDATLGAGLYELEVRSSNTGIRDYLLRLGPLTDVTDGGTFTGGFDRYQDDGYRLELDGPSVLFASTSDGRGGCPGDTIIEVSAGDARVAYDDDGGLGRCSRLEVSLAAGTYNIRVMGWADTAVAAYALEIVTARKLEGSGAVEGGFQRGTEDTYQLSVAAASSFEAWTGGANGCPGDTVMTLYRASNRGRSRVAYDDDGGEGVCSRLRADLDPGTYHLVVAGYGGRGVAPYTLEVRRWMVLPWQAPAGESDAPGHAGIAPLSVGGGPIAVGEAERFTFTLTRARSVAIQTGGASCPGDTFITLNRLVEGGAEQVAADDDSGTGFCSLLSLVLPPGRYEIVVRGYDWRAVPQYALALTFGGPAPLLGMRCSYGRSDCAPHVRDVLQSVGQLAYDGELISAHMNGHPALGRGDGFAGTSYGWNQHAQGVQRLPIVPGTQLDGRYMVMSWSRRDRRAEIGEDGETVLIPQSGGRLRVVQMGTRDADGLRFRSNKLAFGVPAQRVAPSTADGIVSDREVSEYEHPGGMQAIGKHLLVAMEDRVDAASTPLGSIWAYDMSTPTDPRIAWRFALDFKPGVVAVAKLFDNRYLMVVGGPATDELNFYVSTATSLDVTPGWRLLARWSSAGVGGWLEWQGLNLVVEEDGDLYLLGMWKPGLEGTSARDQIAAYRVRVGERSGTVVLTEMARRVLFCSAPEQNVEMGGIQCDFKAGTGVYVDPNHDLLLYATEHHDRNSPPWFRMKEFRHVPDAGEDGGCSTLDGAWIELYKDVDFEDRSIMLDYRDRARRDLDDLDTIESFGGIASSARWCLPRGHRFAGWTEPNRGGRRCEFVGTGVVQTDSTLRSRCGNDAISSGQWQ